MKKVMLGLFVVLALMVSSVFAADMYTIDHAHSNLSFSVKHMMISNTSGMFSDYDGTIAYDANDLANSKIDVTIQANSINTNNEKRDEHLKSADFFDAGKFPTINFVSKNITASSITGDLTIKGVTKEVTIPATISGPVPTMMGGMAIGITGSLTINRQDYGVTWNKALDKGGLAVSNDVLINFSVEAAQATVADKAKEMVKGAVEEVKEGVEDAKDMAKDAVDGIKEQMPNKY